MAASIVTLAACSASHSNGPAALPPDPVLVERVRVEMVCPAELKLDVPPRPAPAADARIEGNAGGMAWLRAVLVRAGLLEARLVDAARECP